MRRASGFGTVYSPAVKRARPVGDRIGARLRAAGPIVLLAGLVVGCGEPAPRKVDNLVLISLDTVRRDHLATYGYERDTAPALDRLASEGTVFDNAFTQAVTTNPSHTSMLTGLYPHTHGSMDNGWRLRDDQLTLAQMLQEAGFATGAFVSGSPLLARASGLDRGFDTYDDDFDDRRRSGAITVERAISWLDGLPDDRRYFVFVHLYDSHGPYMPNAEYEKLFESSDQGPPLERLPRYQQVRGAPLIASLHVGYYVDRYDATIRYQDDAIARLLDKIDPDTTAVVILSDHGETFDERYWQVDHGGQVFDEQIRIPLVARVPGRVPSRIENTVETTDLAPTFLDLLGLSRPEGLDFQGRSLAPLLEGSPGWTDRYAFSGASSKSKRHEDRGYVLDEDQRIYSVRSPEWKLILYPGLEQDYLELYELETDARESTNVASEHAQVAERLLDVLLDWRGDRSIVPGPAPDLSEELREKLRSLGYID